MRTHIRRGLIVGMLASLVLLVGVAPAGAHAELDSSDPADGATLGSAPSALTFTFGENILEQGNAVTLTVVDSDTRLELGPLTVDRAVVSVDWPEASPAGSFRAAYRVVSADGHPIDGAVTFTVEQARGVAAATPSPAADTPRPVVASAVAGSPSAAPTATATATATEEAVDTGSGAGPLAWILWLGLAMLIGVGAGTWVMRRAR